MCEDNGGFLASIRSSEEDFWIVNTFLPQVTSSRNFCTIKTFLLMKRWRVMLLLGRFKFQINLPIKPFVHLQSQTFRTFAVSPWRTHFLKFLSYSSRSSLVLLACEKICRYLVQGLFKLDCSSLYPLYSL